MTAPRIPVSPVVVQFPAHPADCVVCGGSGRVRWCGVRPGVGGDVVAGWLGWPTRCLSLPILDMPVRRDVPRGGAA